MILSFAGAVLGGIMGMVNGVEQPFEGAHILRIVLAFVVTLPLAIIYLTGGANFAKQTGLASARTVAVVACIPCFNCVILTPFGIWAAILVFSDAGKREFDSSY